MEGGDGYFQEWLSDQLLSFFLSFIPSLSDTTRFSRLRTSLRGRRCRRRRRSSSRAARLSNTALTAPTSPEAPATSGGHVRFEESCVFLVSTVPFINFHPLLTTPTLLISRINATYSDTNGAGLYARSALKEVGRMFGEPGDGFHDAYVEANYAYRAGLKVGHSATYLPTQ
jgi:hypothetical protein